MRARCSSTSTRAWSSRATPGARAWTWSAPSWPPARTRLLARAAPARPAPAPPRRGHAPVAGRRPRRGRAGPRATRGGRRDRGGADAHRLLPGERRGTHPGPSGSAGRHARTHGHGGGDDPPGAVALVRVRLGDRLRAHPGRLGKPAAPPANLNPGLAAYFAVWAGRRVRG